MGLSYNGVVARIAEFGEEAGVGSGWGRNDTLRVCLDGPKIFAGSEGGGRTWATVATLLQTAKMNAVDPLDWLSLTLTRIAQGWPAAEIEALMPWNFKPDVIG